MVIPHWHAKNLRIGMAAKEPSQGTVWHITTP